MESLSEDELKGLIRSPKPAFAASGTTSDPSRDPTFRVIHDGRGAWMIERPTSTELLVGGRTVLVQADAVEVIDMPVAVNNDVKAALDGRRLAYLAEGSLEMTGTTVVAGRRCFRVRAWGLKRGRDEPFELAVDTETGAILGMWDGGEQLFEVTEFRVGAPPPELRAQAE